jgi:hypothetical protein
MKLSELKKFIDHYSANSPFDQDDLDVVVVTSDPSIGGRSYVNVTGIHPGFDWESGRLNITVDKAVVRKTDPIQIDLQKKEEALYTDIKKTIKDWEDSKRSSVFLASNIMNTIKKHNDRNKDQA